MQKVIYCDEYGNTGARLLDTNQPALVYAFVILDEGALPKVEAAIQEIPTRKGALSRELKSTGLIGSTLGESRYAAIGRIVCEAGGNVVLSIVEKRYQACTMIAETFLDPYININARPEFAEAWFRQLFSNACYDAISDARLSDFLATVESNSASAIISVGKQFAATLRLHPNDYVAHAAGYIDCNEDTVFRYCQERKELPRNSDIPASQYAGFYPGLMGVERYLAQTNANAVLIRDEDLHFGDALDAAFSRGRQLDDLPGGYDYGATPLERIQTSRIGSSAQELGIQLADLAAGIFGRLTACFVNKKRPSGNLKKIGRSWGRMLPSNGSHYLMVSDARLPAVTRELFSAGSKELAR